jgi:hypothetical protein
MMQVVHLPGQSYMTHDGRLVAGAPPVRKPVDSMTQPEREAWADQMAEAALLTRVVLADGRVV